MVPSTTPGAAHTAAVQPPPGPARPRCVRGSRGQAPGRREAWCCLTRALRRR